MGRTFDVIVAGVGGMGASACWHLARRGLRVLGLERFDIPHAFGSSHGVNRIIRLAYFEHPSYVPMLRRAYDLWRETEDLAGEQLLHITGGLDAGTEASDVFHGALASCREHGLAHEVLDAPTVRERFPGFRLPDGYRAVYQPDGGFVASERAIVAHVELAQRHGAEIRAREPVLDWSTTGADGVEVTTATATYAARHLVLSTGAWIADSVPGLAGKAVPERQVLGWFQPKTPDRFAPPSFPVTNLKLGEKHFYCLPVWGVPGFKIGLYNHLRETGHPDELNRDAGPRDEAVLREALREVFPEADGPVMALRTCLFTNTSDQRFIIDRLPDAPQVIVASPCSGHGFKFASVIGEVIADLVERRTARLDLDAFRIGRLS